MPEPNQNKQSFFFLKMEQDQTFQEELSWCIEYLETLLESKRMSEKQAKDISKAIMSLKNSKNPLAKKRQLMRVHCGDYRTKMNKEDQNFTLKTNVSAKKSNEKSIFLRKQKQEKKPNETKTDNVITSTTPFKFNFQIPSSSTSESDDNTDKLQMETEPPAPKFKMQKSDNTFKFNFAID